MFRFLDVASKCVLGGVFAIAILAHFSAAQARSFKVLHSFSSGIDGCYPDTGLILDGAGNLYGVTAGSGGGCNCGTVFKLAPDGTETPLYNFTCGSNGEGPDTTLVMDKRNNLYGATGLGGSVGCGVIFKVAPDGSEKTVHDFAGTPNDGCTANGPLLVDNGKFYDTTAGGGKNGDGTVFKLATDGTETVLYSFCHKINCADGWNPLAGLIADGAANLFGTAGNGGSRKDFGTVFELAPDGSETVLYKFKGPPNDGDLPESALIADQAGNFYGTLLFGGIQAWAGWYRDGATFLYGQTRRRQQSGRQLDRRWRWQSLWHSGIRRYPWLYCQRSRMRHHL